VVWGVVVGLVLSVGLIVIGPQVWVEILGFERALFPYSYPALFCMPFSFAAIWWFSVTDKTERGKVDRENYHSLLLKSEYGEGHQS
jgi:cation/acetate symporter